MYESYVGKSTRNEINPILSTHISLIRDMIKDRSDYISTRNHCGKWALSRPDERNEDRVTYLVAKSIIVLIIEGGGSDDSKVLIHVGLFLLARPPIASTIHLHSSSMKCLLFDCKVG